MLIPRASSHNPILSFYNTHHQACCQKNVLKLAQLWFEDSYNKNHIYVPYEPGDKVLINIPFNYQNQRALALCSLEGMMAHSRLPNVLVQSLIEFGFLIPMALILCSALRIPNDSGPTLIKNRRTYNPFERIQKNMKLKKSWSSKRNAIAKDTGLCTNADGKIKGLLTNGYQSLISGMWRKLLTHGNSSRKNWISRITLSISTNKNCQESYEMTKSSNILSNPIVFPYDSLHFFQALSENTHLKAPSSIPPPIHYPSPFHPSPILLDVQFPNLFETVNCVFSFPSSPNYQKDWQTKDSTPDNIPATKNTHNTPSEQCSHTSELLFYGLSHGNGPDSSCMGTLMTKVLH